MTDREFLMWIHERLEIVHNEKPLVDYMHKLRAIIRRTPKEKETPNSYSCNSLSELQAAMERDAKRLSRFRAAIDALFKPKPEFE